MITFRRSTPDDAETVSQCVSAVARERRFLATLEGFSVEQTRAFLTSLDAAGGVQIVAMDADRIVGWCDVNPVPFPGMRHVGRVGIGLLPDYRGRGLGRALMERMLEAAALKGLWRIELEVYSNNTRALHLYESVGFVHEGRKRLARIVDGVEEDILIMARITPH